MENTTVVMSMKDFVAYVEYREQQAQLEIINNHIKPYNAAKAKSLINKLRGVVTGTSRKKASPKEIVVKRHNVSDKDYSELKQYIVR